MAYRATPFGKSVSTVIWSGSIVICDARVRSLVRGTARLFSRLLVLAEEPLEPRRADDAHASIVVKHEWLGHVSPDDTRAEH